MEQTQTIDVCVGQNPTCSINNNVAGMLGLTLLEKIYESPLSRVHTVIGCEGAQTGDLPEQRTVLKTSLISTFGTEVLALQRLQGIEGVVGLLGYFPEHNAILTEYINGANLGQLYELAIFEGLPKRYIWKAEKKEGGKFEYYRLNKGGNSYELADAASVPSSIKEKVDAEERELSAYSKEEPDISVECFGIHHNEEPEKDYSFYVSEDGGDTFFLTKKEEEKISQYKESLRDWRYSLEDETIYHIEAPLLTKKEIIRQLGGIMMEIHGRGIAGIDLRNSNVIVTPGGEAMLYDFGLSYISKKGMSVNPEEDEENFELFKMQDGMDIDRLLDGKKERPSWSAGVHLAYRYLNKISYVQQPQLVH